jgi:DNA repair protein RecO (recombination protein O)
MKIIGIQPHGNFSEKTPFFNLKEGAFSNFDNHQGITISEENTQFLSHLLKENTASIPKKNRKELLHILLQYYKIHVDGFKDLKSLKVIASIWD